VQASVINNIDNLIAAFERNPLSIVAVFLLLAMAAIFRWLAKDIKVEHLFQHTLSNKLRFIKNELKEGLIEDQQRAQLRQRYATLLNQKIYGIKNSFIQQEVINIIDKSTEIKDLKYFSIHQYILSIDGEGRLYFNRHKIKARIIDSFSLLGIGLLVLVLGFWIIFHGSAFGLALCVLGIILYFGGLGHFPASLSMRKRAEKEIANYYQHRDTSET